MKRTRHAAVVTIASATLLLLTGCTGSPDPGPGDGADDTDKDPQADQSPASDSPLELEEWMAAFCQDAATASSTELISDGRPSVLNADNPEELGTAQTAAGQYADLNRLIAQAWGRPLNTDIEYLTILAPYYAQQAAWSATWWDNLREKTRTLEPEEVVTLWRATDGMDESFDLDTVLSLNTDPVPEAPTALPDSYEQDSVELQALMDQHPGCSENGQALQPGAPSGVFDDL